MQQIKKKFENPTFSAIAPENDFIANLPKTSKADNIVKCEACTLLGSNLDDIIIVVNVIVVIIPAKS